MKKNNQILDTIAILGMMNSWGDPRHSQYLEAMQPYVVEKKMEKCLLPGCEVQTKHNGGYCCGDHCRKHNEIRKNKNCVND